MNESIESIVTEMRERADAMQTHGTTHGVRLAVLEFARRIEAAWKRERAKVEADALEVGGIVEAARTAEKSSAVGNAAAIREALVAMVEAETDGSMDRDDLCGRCLEKMWDRCKHDGSCWVDKVINALSAPLRNCDLYDSQPKMSEAYESYRKAAMKKYGDGLVGGVPTIKQKPMTYDEWLLAPATERKGDGDGR